MVEPEKCPCGKEPQSSTYRLPSSSGQGSTTFWAYRCACGRYARAGTSPQEGITNWNEQKAAGTLKKQD